MQMRINKYIKECGIASRRGADEIIAEGRVTVNGRVAGAGEQVTDGDIVCVDGKEIVLPEKKHYVAFYKPVGVTCSKKDEHAEVLLDDVFAYPFPLTYAGRLDRDSEGLLLMTDDGDLIEELMRGRNAHEKEYIVTMKKKVTDEFVKKFSGGVWIEELKVTTRPCRIKKTGDYEVNIILTQGLNRQIRRMSEVLGNEVNTLKRVRVANVLLGELKPGEFRELDEEEFTKLYNIITGKS